MSRFDVKARHIGCLRIRDIDREEFKMKIETVGARLYVTGNSYDIKDRLRSIGCHWDGERKQWWIGKGKLSSLQSVVGNGSQAALTGEYIAPTPEELSDKPCIGKIEYKRRQYYVVGKSNSGKLFLTVLDCSMSFWAEESSCKWIKRYEAREERGSYGRSTGRYRHQTVGSIRRFVEQAKSADQAIARGEMPEGYCVDMEDGMVKRRSECDMPSN